MDIPTPRIQRRAPTGLDQCPDLDFSGLRRLQVPVQSKKDRHRDGQWRPWVEGLAAMREQFAHLGSDVVGRYLRDAKSSPASEESIMDALSRLGL